MGINRVGGGNVPPETVAPAEGSKKSAGTGATFEVERGRTAAAAPATEVKGSAALEGVKSGSLDVNGYVDAKVQEATQHLSHLTLSQLAKVQEIVKGQLLADPHLRELVEHATGSALPKNEE